MERITETHVFIAVVTTVMVTFVDK